jgi:hypothetical protein
MKFNLCIYKIDARTKIGVRLVGSYIFIRKDKESMIREMNSLYPLYKKSDGYVLVLIESPKNE